MFYAHNMLSQKKFDFDKTILVGKESEVYSERQIIIDEDNNKYLVSFFKGQIDILNFTLSTSINVTNNLSLDSKGLFVVKYDKNDSLLWAKKIAESETLLYYYADCDNSGNLYFSFQYKNSILLENDTITCLDDGDICLIKYSPNGIKKFIKVFGNNGNETITGFDFDNANNIIVTGSFGLDTAINYPLTLDNYTIYSDKFGIFIATLDTLGTTVWAKSFDGNGYEGSTNLKYYDNSIYLMGYVYNSNVIDIGGISITFPANFDSKCFISKLDIAGNPVWIKKFGNQYNNNGLGYIIPKSLAVAGNRVCITSIGIDQIQLVFLFEGAPNLAGGTSDFDYFIAAYDTSGNFKWNTIARSPYTETLNQLSADSLGNVYGIGNMVFSSYFPNDTLYTNGSDDVLLCSYDSSGNFRWATHGGGVSTDIGSSIALDNNGKIFIVGGTTSSGGCMMGNDTLYPPANQSTMFFASLDSIDATWPLQNTVQFHESFQIEVYPNPAYKYLYVDMKQVETQTKNEHTLIKMQNALGQIVYITQVAEKHSNTPNSLHTIDISSYPNGIYFFSLISDQQAISKKIIIQH